MIDVKIDLLYRDECVYIVYYCPYCGQNVAKFMCHQSSFNEKNIDDFLGEEFCPSTLKIFWLTR